MLEVLALLTGVTGAPQQAIPAPLVELELSAPAACPSSSVVLDAVRQRVKHAAAEPLRVRAQIEHHERWSLLLETEQGERRVEGESCEAVAQTLVVLLALAVDPGADVESTGWSPELASPTTAEKSSQTAAEAAPRPEQAEPTPAAVAPAKPHINASARRPRRESRSSPLRWPTLGVALGALGEVGALPKPSFGATGGLSASWQPWSLKLGAAFLVPQFAQVESSSARKGGYVSWWSGNLELCRSFAVVVSACLGTEVGRLTGVGRGVQSRTTGHALWLAAGPSLAGHLPLERGFSLFAKLGVYLPIFRPGFGVEPYGELYSPAVASGRLVLGISYR